LEKYKNLIFLLFRFYKT